MTSEETLKMYERPVKIFLKRFDLTDAEFIAKADRGWAESQVVAFIREQKARVERHEVSGTTVVNDYMTPLRLFLTMSDVPLNWDKLNKLLPKSRKYRTDRAPTFEEVKALVDHCDERLKAAVPVVVSSGMRAGSWKCLSYGDVSPCIVNCEVVAAQSARGPSSLMLEKDQCRSAYWQSGRRRISSSTQSRFSEAASAIFHLPVS